MIEKHGPEHASTSDRKDLTGQSTEPTDASIIAQVQLVTPSYGRVVYDMLLGMVIRFELPPGTRLTEVKLATMLNVSKTPVREAIAMLVLDGLVESSPHKGARVGWMSMATLWEQAFLVDTLEDPAYDRVIERITDEEIAGIELVIEQLQRARQDRDGRTFGRLTQELHKRVFEPAGFPRLDRMIASVIGGIGLRQDWLMVYPYDDSWDIQMAIMAARAGAVKRRDADAAREMVHKHRTRLIELHKSRLNDPEIARYFRD